MAIFGFVVLALIWCWLVFVVVFTAYFQYNAIGWGRKETVGLLISIALLYASFVMLVGNAPFELVMR